MAGHDLNTARSGLASCGTTGRALSFGGIYQNQDSAATEEFSDGN